VSVWSKCFTRRYFSVEMKTSETRQWTRSCTRNVKLPQNLSRTPSIPKA